jgi:hypothetical protein
MSTAKMVRDPSRGIKTSRGPRARAFESWVPARMGYLLDSGVGKWRSQLVALGSRASVSINERESIGHCGCLDFGIARFVVDDCGPCKGS